MATSGIRKFISDEEMSTLEKTNNAPAFISDEEMEKKSFSADEIQDLTPEIAQKPGGLLLKTISDVGEIADRYTGAPIRAGVKGALDAPEGKKTLGFLSGVKEQFGKPTRLAPTPREQIESFGFKEEGPTLLSLGDKKVTSKDVAAGAYGLLADPTNVLLASPARNIATKAARGILEAGSTVAKAPVRLSAKAGNAALNTLSKGIEKTIPSVVEASTGIPKQAVNKYLKNTQAVDSMIQKYGDDIASASDDVKERAVRTIQDFRQQLNNTISESVEALSQEKNVKINDVLQFFDDSKRKINVDLNPEQVAEISAIQDRIKKTAVINPENGDAFTDAKTLFDIKTFLQQEAKPSYLKSGQVYSRGDLTQKVAKKAERLVRQDLNKISPDIAKANNMHSELHKIEENLGRNILAPGKSEAGLLSAGSDTNKKNVKLLKKLDSIAGTNLLEDAEALAAVKYFAKPSLTNVLSTGKSLATTVVGAAGGLPGALVGAAVSSPMAWKSAIRTGKFGKDLMRSVLNTSQMTEKNIDLLASILSSNPTLASGFVGSRAASEAKKSGLLDKLGAEE